MFWSFVPDRASKDEMVALTIPPVMSLLLHGMATHLICHTHCATVSNDEETTAPTFYCFCHITVMSRLCHLHHITMTSRAVAHPLVTLPPSEHLQKQQDTHHPPLLPWHDDKQGSCAPFSTYDANWPLMPAELSCMLTSYYANHITTHDAEPASMIHHHHLVSGHHRLKHSTNYGHVTTHNTNWLLVPAEPACMV